ncbi:unnamed protein product [Rotaria magnacalcarata]|uniref:Uncharacterized protein n=1 Tax=Rotaria magnacalcarata TaxID=392030 RepID=A0A8S2M7S6_9BILA|nr:unnamed protein product [Rotaria magnacalcarata]
MLPNEIIDRISKELFGIDLFHFTLANESHLAISNYHLIQLLRLKSNIKLDKEIKSLLDMSKSPYMIVQNGIGLVLSSYKWSDFVYGAFKFNMIQKSLKYYSTTTFFLYCRLWSFTPFYYEASYPTLDIFAYSYICAAAFNSKKVIISFACLQALNSGFTTCYAVPFSTSEFMKRAPRFYKYQQRGFNILIPQQFDINKFLATPVEDCKETRPEQIYRFRRRHFGDNCDSFSIQKKFCEYYNLI